MSLARTAAEVRLAAPVWNTSSALAAVSGVFRAMMVEPTTEGVVRLPLALVVPFRPRLAQLPQSWPIRCWKELLAPTTPPATRRQLSVSL
jgi:hypothetical protein